MKVGLSIPALVALLIPSSSPRADEIRLDDVVARAPREVVVRSALEDNALLELCHRALLDATGADVSLAFPLPAGTRVAAGAITARQALAWSAADDRIATVPLKVAELAGVLERGAAGLPAYAWDEGAPLSAAPAADSLWVTAQGVSYEVDLTAPAGARIVHLAWRGTTPDPERTLQVAATLGTLRRLGLAAAPGAAEAHLGDRLLARLRSMGTLVDASDRHWSVLPDYATTTERPLIDRLVRLGVAPRDELMRLYPDQPARRGELAYWLARAFGWRETRLSGAYPDVPDSLEPWLDGLEKRKILGALASEEFFQPFAAVRLPMLLDWCEGAARSARYAIGREPEPESFRRSLFSGTSWPSQGRVATRDTVTRAQLLGFVANARFPAIRILETTDLHGAMEPGPPGARQPGSAALAATLDRLRGENPEGSILLDGGDAFQGTLVSSLSFGRTMVEQMNRFGYVAMAIGNHEFDWSVDTLACRIDEMRFAALAANLSEARTGKRPRWARADTILDRRGVRVAVFGLAFPRTPTVTLPRNVSALRFADDSTTAGPLPVALRARGAAVVIGLGHVPGTIDSAGRVGGALGRLASLRGVDAWLGGHSHTWVDGEVRGIPTLIPGSHGEGVAVCDLVVDPLRGRVVERRHRLVEVGADSLPPDAGTAELVARWAKDVADAARAPVGASASKLGKQRAGESAIGSLVADVMRSATRAEVGLQNNTSLRAELPEGPVTYATIYQILPFENVIVTLELTGHEIRRVLEEGLAGDQAIQVSGIRYRFDLGRPAGSRVTELTDADRNPLDEARTFRVACNNFMADGGDDLQTLTTGRARVDTDIRVRDALAAEVRERSRSGALHYSGDGRVAREPGSPPPAHGD